MTTGLLPGNGGLRWDATVGWWECTNTYYYQGRRIDRGLSVAVAGWRGDPGPEDDGGEVGECSGVALG